MQKHISSDLLRRKWNRHDQQRRLPAAVKLTIELERETRFLLFQTIENLLSGKSYATNALLFLIGGAYVELRREAAEAYIEHLHVFSSVKLN